MSPPPPPPPSLSLSLQLTTQRTAFAGRTANLCVNAVSRHTAARSASKMTGHAMHSSVPMPAARHHSEATLRSRHGPSLADLCHAGKHRPRNFWTKVKVARRRQVDAYSTPTSQYQTVLFVVRSPSRLRRHR